jgi:hypothetical protein
MAAATLENVRAWGDGISYYPVPAEIAGVAQEAVKITCNGEVTSVFRLGNTVVIDGDSHKVELCGPGMGDLLCLKRVRRSLFRPLRAALMRKTGLTKLMDCHKGVEVLKSTAPKIDDLSRARMEFALIESYPWDPAITAMMGQGKSVAAGKAFKDSTRALDLCEHALKAQQLLPYADLERSGTSVKGGKPYQWGYCYSCGCDRTGKRMRGRVCQDGCSADKLSNKLTRAGYHVANHGRPVVYPGVVETESNHPPLKKSAKSTVQENCAGFRPPHSV